MGHACTKDANAEKVERRRVERERRLGLVRQPPQTQLSQPAALMPNGMWPRGVVAQQRGRNSPAFQIRPVPQVQQPQFMPQYHQPQVLYQTQQPASVRPFLQTPERPKANLPNPNSPFHDPRLRSMTDGDASHQSQDSSGTLKPVVVQALNQLCAIELQVRVATINEEMWSRNELLIELERLQEMESFRVAALELVALEARSRASITGQVDQAYRSMLQFEADALQEARLTALVRETQERHSRSLPSSAHTTPAKSRPFKQETPAASQTQTARTTLGWAPELVARPTSFRYVSPPRAYPTRVTDYSGVAEVADRVASQEEEALNAKIARQRGLIDSTRSLYHTSSLENRLSRSGPVRSVPTAPSPLPPQPLRQAPTAPTEESNYYDPGRLSLREASFEATRNRINALSYYQ